MMTATTMLHTLTPDQLTELVTKAIRTELDSLKKDFQPVQPPQYLTRKQAAHRLGGISLVCLHDWTRKGILQDYKIGNRVFYKAEEVDGVVEANKVNNSH